MKSKNTIIWQALLFAVILTLVNTFIASIGEARGFIELLLRWSTLIQFVILGLVWGFFFYFRNKRINDQNNR